jgi:hypothetical protein
MYGTAPVAVIIKRSAMKTEDLALSVALGVVTKLWKSIAVQRALLPLTMKAKKKLPNAANTASTTTRGLAQFQG